MVSNVLFSLRVLFEVDGSKCIVAMTRAKRHLVSDPNRGVFLAAECDDSV